jgi:transcription initiation factor TFIIF subunit alpha
MPPVPPSASVLFHPKAKKKGGLAKQPVASASSSSSSQEKRPAAAVSSPKPSPPKSQPVAEEQEPQPTLPEGQYREYKLVSSSTNGWKYDIMKLESRKPTSILRWSQPVKLNRKDLRRAESAAEGTESTQVAVQPMLGPDGKPVIGADGRIVMLDAEGKPIHKDGPSARKPPGQGGRKRIQKKTKQVFKVPEETRQLRREERYPWVFEDESGNETWVAQMEEASKSETLAMFMPTNDGRFKFVAPHRWYKFQKKPKHAIPTLDEAEKLVCAVYGFCFTIA